MAQYNAAQGLTIVEATPQTFDTAFLDVPYKIYENVPEWIAPLRFEVAGFLKAKSPYLAHANARYFIAKRGDTLVGRISAQVDRLVAETMGQGTGQFGYFECEDNPETSAALLGAAEAWLKGQGMTRILGPFNPSINEEVGLLIDGFDTPNVMLMPHGRPYYRALVEAQGYQKVKELYAYDFDVRPELDARFLKMEAWVDKNPDLEVRFIDKRNVQADIALALDIFNEAWRDNWGFTPMTDGEAERFGKSLALILQPDLGAFAYLKGEPIAFMITLPDLNSIIHDLEGKLFPLNWAKLLYRLKRKRFARARTPLLGVRKAHQNTRLGGMLSIYIISKIRRETLKYGMTHCELSWILEDNPGINNMLSSIGGEIYKRYGIFEKTL